MKHIYLRRFTSILLTCFMLIALLPNTTFTVYATNVGGIYYVSDFVEYDDLKLIEDTTIFVNEDITLRSISGDYNLDIQSDGIHKLKINNPNGRAIDVKSLKCSAPLDLIAKSNAIYAPNGSVAIKGDLTATTTDNNTYCIVGGTGVSITNGTINITTNYGAVSSENGNVHMSGNITVVSTQDDSEAIETNSGDITIEGDTYISSGGTGICASGDVIVNGNIGIRANKGHGIISETGKINITGDATIEAFENALCATDTENGSITVKGDLTANTESDIRFCIVGYNDVSVVGEKIKIISNDSATVSWNGDIYMNGDITVGSTLEECETIKAYNGNIEIEGKAFIIAAGTGIYAENGDIKVDGDIEVKALTGCGIKSEVGKINISGDVIINAYENALCAVDFDNGGITVTGNLNAKTKSDNFNCILGRGVTLNGGTIDITSNVNTVTSWYGDINMSGKITATSTSTDSVAINARGGNIVINGGPLYITTAGKDALYAYEGIITLNNSWKILEPQNGHIENNIIADENGNSVSCVEVGQNIDIDSIYINSPVGGEKPVSSTKDVYGLPTHSLVKYVKWYANDILLSDDHTFVPGQKYEVKIALEAEKGYRFTNNSVVNLNGNNAITELSNSNKEIIISYTFDSCPASIKNVELDVNAPSDGKIISYSVTDNSAAYSVTGNSDWVRWYESSDGVNYTLMNSGAKFVIGKNYKVEIDVATHTGYEFALKDVGTIQPDVSATVNGNIATVIKAYDQDPSKVITVIYTFVYEVQNVSDVEVLDIDVPVGNLTPDYTATLGNENLYELAPYGYEFAGFWWYDKEDNVLGATDKFKKGETYKLEIKLINKMDGQRVLTQFKTPITAKLNGKVVDPADVMANSTTVYIYQTYTCDEEHLTKVSVANVQVKEPVAGKKPSYEAISGDSDKYTVTINSWYADGTTQKVVSPNEVFVEGNSYHVKVTFVPKAGYTFAEDTIFTINGKSVTTWGRNGQEQVSFKAYDVTKPVATVTAGNGQVEVRWEAISGATKYQVCSYLGGKYTVQINNYTGTSYTVTGLTNGTKYGFLVRAYRNGAWTTYSTADLKYATPSSGSILKPTITVTTGNKQVTVKWNAVSGATKYQVCSYVGGKYTVQANNYTGTSYTVTGLTNGTKYGFLVRAYGNGVWTTYSTADLKYATPSNSISKPVVTVTAGNTQATVKWNAVSGATKYQVCSYVDGKYTVQVNNYTGTSYTVTGLTNGTKYGFLVRAYGNGAWTTYGTADLKYVTPQGTIAKPTVTVTAGNKQVTIKWNAVSGATKYQVCSYVGGKYTVQVNNYTGTSYTVTGLTNGTKYGFLVRAYGNGVWTTYSTADLKYATPAVPSTKPTVEATAGNKQVAVKWNAVSGATKYQVVSYVGGKYTVQINNYTGTSYTVTGLANGTKYGFLVRAYVNGVWTSYSTADLVYATPSL